MGADSIVSTSLPVGWRKEVDPHRNVNRGRNLLDFVAQEERGGKWLTRGAFPGPETVGKSGI